MLAMAVARTAGAQEVIAKQRAAAKVVFDAQIAALRAGDATAFAATFIEDGAAARLPDGAIVAKRSDIAPAITAWLGGKPTSVAVAGEPSIAARPNATWITADLTVATKARTDTLRFTEMIVGLYDDKGSAAAVMLSRAVDDKQLVGEKAGAKVSGDASELFARVASPKLLEKELSYSGDIVVIGTAPTERAVGRDAARKLLHGWRDLKLTLVGAQAAHEDDQMLSYALGQVSMARAGKLPVTLDVLVIAVHSMSQDGSRPWEVTSVHYAAHTSP